MPEGPVIPAGIGVGHSASEPLRVDLPRLKHRWLNTATLSMTAFFLLAMLLHVLGRALGLSRVGMASMAFILACGWMIYVGLSFWGTWRKRRWLELGRSSLVAVVWLPPFRPSRIEIAFSEIQGVAVRHRLTGFVRKPVHYLEVIADGRWFFIGEGAEPEVLRALASRLAPSVDIEAVSN